jgi:putative membrane protein
MKNVYNFKSRFILFLKGLAMGSADIVPGVSGGTIAFITGIYEKLINSIKSVDIDFVKDLFGLKFKIAFERINFNFLLPLFLGIATALISLAHIVSFMLENYRVYTWSFFFGLILASILFIGKKIKNPIDQGGIGLLLGIVFGYILVGLIPVETPNELWFIFVSGMIAISAMILPGISGSFILLLLSKYEYMINALKNPFIENNFLIIIIFISGCAVGVIAFSRVLSYMFKKHYNLTVAILTGLIIGSLRKIWPWKEVLESRMIHDELRVIDEMNILPNLNFELLGAVLLIIAGFILVTFLSKYSKNS